MSQENVEIVRSLYALGLRDLLAPDSRQLVERAFGKLLDEDFGCVSRPLG